MNDNDLPSGPSAFEWHKFQSDLRHSSWRLAYEAANAAGRTALNSLLLASGGAVVALLAFLGNLLSKDTSHDYVAQTHVAEMVQGVTLALTPLVSSMFLAIVAAALTYLAMSLFAGAAGETHLRKKAWFNRAGHFFNGGAVVVGIISLGNLWQGATVGLQMLKLLG